MTIKRNVGLLSIAAPVLPKEVGPGVWRTGLSECLTARRVDNIHYIVQGLCESRGGRPGLSVLTSLLVSVDVKIY